MRGMNVVTIKSLKANTGIIYFGQSQNAAKDGSDVTAISRTYSLEAGEVSPPVILNNLEEWYIQSTVATQRYHILINP